MFWLLPAQDQERKEGRQGAPRAAEQEAVGDARPAWLDRVLLRHRTRVAARQEGRERPHHLDVHVYNVRKLTMIWTSTLTTPIWTKFILDHNTKNFVKAKTK